MRPAVSVMMVCYNAAPTLPWALGSLLAQTSDDWECIFVDDGSTDGSSAIATGLGDTRIRAFRFATNRGRGAARQFALERAQGEYLCMLDADDWMYPWRCKTEQDFLEAEPEAAIVSAGMAILDGAGDLTGVRGNVGDDNSRVLPPITRLRTPPFPFAASMIRMRVAKLCKFDPKLPIVEDMDFLMRIILNHGYAILNRNLYAYNEYSAVTLQKLMDGSHFARQSFQKHRAKFPLQCRANNLKVFAKSVVHRGAFSLNCSDWLVRRRFRPPTSEEFKEFQWAHGTVASKVEEIFGISEPVERKLHSSVGALSYTKERENAPA